MKSNKRYLVVGLVLLGSFFLQAALDIQWQWLQQLQRGETYKRISGLVLVIYLAEQWALSWFRTRGPRKQANAFYKIHQQLGALSPLYFYIHSVSFGHSYLLLLSFVYFANAGVGLLNPASLKIRQKTSSFYWMIGHVALSVITVALALFHIFIVFYYE